MSFENWVMNNPNKLLVTNFFVEKLQRKLQNKENGNLERELSGLFEILLSVRRMPYGKERKGKINRINR